MLTVTILGREIIAIKWTQNRPAEAVVAAPADPAANGSGLGGTFERGAAAASLPRFGFKVWGDE
jgi:hypothetical protein